VTAVAGYQAEKLSKATHQSPPFRALHPTADWPLGSA
jgi:hypothetical protein